MKSLKIQDAMTGIQRKPAATESPRNGLQEHFGVYVITAEKKDRIGM